MTFSVHGGSFSYKSGRQIFRDISFRVGQGEVLAILGPNGVGKTTLLRCMMGLLRWDAGDSRIDGVPIPDIPVAALWRKIAYVPQAKHSAFAFSALDMVLMGRSAHIGSFAQPTKQDKQIAQSCMEQVGIAHLATKLCNEMSGGELQMVLISRALASQADMLVLDEPESNLDFKNQLVILDVIERLARGNKLSCVFNTHYPAHALRVSTNALLLSQDGSSRFGLAREIINERNMQTSFQVNVHINDVFLSDRSYTSITALSIV